MKQNILRRLGALALAFALTLSLAVVPAMALDGVTVSITGTNSLTVGGADGTLTASVEGLAADNSMEVTGYEWAISGGVATLGGDTASESVTVSPGSAAGTASVTVKATIKVTGDDGTTTEEEVISSAFTVTVSAATVDPTDPPTPPTDTPDPTPTPGGDDEDLPAPTSITLTNATVEIGNSHTIVYTTIPEKADMSKFTWTSSNTAVATVDQNGVVTAKAQGTTQITATIPGTSVGNTCIITVPEKTVYPTSILFSPASRQIDKTAGQTEQVSVIVNPAESTQVIEWSVEDTSVVTVESVAGTSNKYQTSQILRVVGPGTTRVTARVKASEAEGDYKEAVLSVTVSGVKITNPPADMTEFQSYQLQYERYGAAATASGRAEWTSSDPATVAVGATGGNLLALKQGTVNITLKQGNYTDTCQVRVVEDAASIITMSGSYNSGKPLVMSDIYLVGQLLTMSLNKTTVLDANGNVVTAGSPLSYISNVSVPTEQGTLYYNYNSEANTGAGVGIADRFYYGTAPAGYATLSQLTFVPKQGFSGTAEITFNAVAQSGDNFSGTIRVPVNGSGDGSSIYYGAIAGQPTTFLAEDFNAYCQAVTGRDLNYVIFSLPSTTAGTLYYNYTSASSSGNRVSASTQYSRTGNTNISRVSFVPNQSYTGTVTVNFRGVNTAGTSFTGSVTITVGPSSLGLDPADVSFTAQDGKQVTLRTTEFNNACMSTIGEVLSYVRFSLPDASEGVLYYNYSGSSSSRVDSTTRYYFSGTPGIGSVTFVAAANAGGQVAIPYTGYSSSGATYTGTLYINLQNDSLQTTIRYAVNKNSVVALQAADFNSVCLRLTGYSMDYVQFAAPTSTASGNPPNLLYYNYRSNLTRNTRVTSNTSYYRAYDSRYPSRYMLGYISFLAGSTAGTVSIPYTIYANTTTTSGTKTVSGTLEILVGAPTPADVTLSATTASAVWLPGTSIRNACSAVMNNDLSYIEITSVPGEKEGRVYSVYNGINTGTEVSTGTRYYRAGSPSMDQLSFVPYGGFNGTATITYIGYSADGKEQVSGQIKITVTNSTTSRYFNDMANHGWAADAVDFLYENNISNGVGGGRYSPSGTLTRGDFTLMLVRTFGFTSSTIARFNDVPSSSYYAQAISTAKVLGITVGESGGNFYPKQAITRQDAMVMLYNALKASGNTMTNGLTADLSGFSDRSSISNYALEAVGTLVYMGVVKGDGNGHLSPTKSLSRAETAILLQYVLTL